MVNNFIPQKDFKKLKDHMESADFPWYFNPTVVTAPPKIDTYFQFTHFFYRKGMWCSDHSWVLKPILEKIKPLSILHIKANLNPRETKHIEHGFHNDFAFTDNAKITTAIFYVNTNNGYTLFENGDKVKSVANTWCEFSATRKHTGSTCTDEKKRIVINVNFIK